MRRFCTLLLLLWPLLAALSVQAQEFVLDQPQRGRIYLHSGDSLEGSFTINLANDLLQISQENTIKTLTARQVDRFWFDDGMNRGRRYFLSLPFTMTNGYRIPAFFEIILDGPAMALLAREQVLVETMPVYDPLSNRTIMSSRQRLLIDHYFMNEQGIITRYHGRRKDLYAIFADKQEAVKNFLDATRTGIGSRTELIRITDYYNSIKSKPLPAHGHAQTSDHGKQ